MGRATGIRADKAASRTNHGRHLGAQRSTWYLEPGSRGPAHHRFLDFSFHLSANHQQHLGRHSPPHVACSTSREILPCQTPGPGAEVTPSCNRLIPSPSWSLNPMPEGAGRRPGRHGGLDRSGMHRTGAHDAVAWAVAEDGEQRRPIGTCFGSCGVLWEPLFKRHPRTGRRAP